MKRYDRHGEFTVQCHGRDETGSPVFYEGIHKPVTVRVLITKRPGSNDLFSLVRCPYLSGSHGDRCDAFKNLDPGIMNVYVNHKPDIRPVKAGDCAYSFNIPGMIDNLERDRK